MRRRPLKKAILNEELWDMVPVFGFSGRAFVFEALGVRSSGFSFATPGQKYREKACKKQWLLRGSNVGT